MVFIMKLIPVTTIFFKRFDRNNFKKLVRGLVLPPSKLYC